MGHQIDATGPELGVCFHRPQSEISIEKLSQRVVKAVKGVKIFFQLLALGYEKFPHNTTGQYVRVIQAIQIAY